MFKKCNAFELSINTIVGLCVTALFVAIFIDFIEYHGRDTVKQEKKSVVETGTMTLFFLFFYVLIKLKAGVFSIDSQPLRNTLSVIGLFLVILGCAVNIAGRLTLGNNWANQIKIYKDHTLVVKGVYSIVRHPLYASIIWMFYGASLIYRNFAAFAANTIIFIPFVYYRAKQEEILLNQFKDYSNYRAKTGMFFPKLSRRSDDERV